MFYKHWKTAINSKIIFKMKKLAFMMMAFAIAAVSCKEKDVPAPAPEVDAIPLQIATSVTRATEYAFEANDAVGLYVVNVPSALQTTGNHIDNAKFTFDGSKWNGDTQYYWKDGNTKADFYCYYPYVSSISSVNSIPFSVNKDQSAETGYKASDFMFGKVAAIAPTPDPVTINVKHAMSCLVINLKAGTGWKDDDLKNAVVTLSGLKTSALVNLADVTVSASGSATEVNPLSAGNNSFKALVVPQAISNTELVKINLAGNSYALKTSIDMTPGKQYSCTVVINRSSEGINIGISPWETDSKDYGGSVE